jgi:hypothetical protein
MDRIGDVGVFRLEGEYRLEPAVKLVADAIRLAREAGLRKLMVVTSGLTSLGPLTVSERLGMVRAWAEATGGRVMLAMVTHPNLIDPERFGVVAAASFGLHSEVFTSEGPALAWLGEQP